MWWGSHAPCWHREGIYFKICIREMRRFSHVTGSFCSISPYKKWAWIHSSKWEHEKMTRCWYLQWVDPSHDNIHLPQLIYTNILKLLGGKESCTYMVDNIHISREMWASKSASRTLSTNPDILWLTEASWLAKKGNVSKIAAEYKMKSLLFGCLLGFIFKKDQVWMREFILKFIFKIIKASSQTADINI